MRMTWLSVYKRLVEARHPFVMRNGKARPSTAFRPLVVGKTLSLGAASGSTAASSGDTPVDFSSGAIILSVSAAASLAIGAAALTQTHRTLEGVRFSLSFPAGEGLIVTGGPVLASAVFGPDGTEQFPPDFIHVERGGTLTAVVQNLTTSAIICDLAFHSIVPR